MALPSQVGRAYDELVGLNGELFAAEQFEAAYHALMAALHCAEDSSNVERLTAVADIARQQGGAIDANAPTHRLSTQRSHGTQSIYAMAAATAEAVIKRLENQQRMAQLRHRR